MILLNFSITILAFLRELLGNAERKRLRLSLNYFTAFLYLSFIIGFVYVNDFEFFFNLYCGRKLILKMSSVVLNLNSERKTDKKDTGTPAIVQVLNAAQRFRVLSEYLAGLTNLNQSAAHGVISSRSLKLVNTVLLLN